MNGLLKAEDLPRDEEIYFKKDIFGYRIVNPIKNADGTFNWINLLFGGYRNLIILLVLILSAGFTIWSYNHDIAEVKSYYANISEDPFYACAKPNPEIDNAFSGKWETPKLQNEEES